MSHTGLGHILAAAAVVFFMCLDVKAAVRSSTDISLGQDTGDLTSNYNNVRGRPTTSPLNPDKQSQGKYKGSHNPLKNGIKEWDADEQHLDISKERDARWKRSALETIESLKGATNAYEQVDEEEEEEHQADDDYEESWPQLLAAEKRKGRIVDGFLGMRGKKKQTTTSRGFVGMRGKKETTPFYGMRGKKDEDKRGAAADTFYGMRGRRQDEDDENRTEEKRNLKNGYLGMRGKKLKSELKRKIQDAFVGMRGKKTEPDREEKRAMGFIGPNADQRSVSPDTDRHVRDVSTFLRQWANQLRRRRMNFDDRMRQADNIFIGMRG